MELHTDEYLIVSKYTVPSRDVHSTLQLSRYKKELEQKYIFSELFRKLIIRASRRGQYIPLTDIELVEYVRTISDEEILIKLGLQNNMLYFVSMADHLITKDSFRSTLNSTGNKCLLCYFKEGEDLYCLYFEYQSRIGKYRFNCAPLSEWGAGTQRLQIIKHLQSDR